MAQSLYPMRIMPPEAFVEYSEGEEVLIDISWFGLSKDDQQHLGRTVPGKIIKKLEKYRYMVKSKYITTERKTENGIVYEEADMCLSSESLRKLEKK